MSEFTGERVIPGQVEPDLWSEHMARYAFARRFANGPRVLDAGCGAGYGTAELSLQAAHVTGFDLSTDAVGDAARTYPLPNAHFLAASCAALPFAASSFDLVAAFEVIEHLTEYREFLAECARVLRPAGLFVVSTPNKLYYAESRERTGPNPFHEHEFEAAEFADELRRAFPHVALLLQNRVEAFAFHPAKTFTPAGARVDAGAGSAADAHFFIGLCSHSPLPELESFVYVPTAANLLRVREQHVLKLQKELTQSKDWLASARADLQQLVDLHRRQTEELESHNRWAEQLNAQLSAAGERVVELQNQLAEEQAQAASATAAYERQIGVLEDENRAKTEWAQTTEARLTAELHHVRDDLARCVQLLDRAEATVEERTLWAQRAEAARLALQGRLDGARASRWLRLGRKLGLGPALEES